MQKGEELRYLFLAVQREGNRQLVEVLRPLGLTPAQAEVLQVLEQYAPMTLIELGERLVCETGSPSRLVNSMVKAGWVEKKRSPDDGRAVALSLTEKAQAVMPELNLVENAYNQNVGELIDPDTMQLAIDLLWKLAEDTESGKALKHRINGD